MQGVIYDTGHQNCTPVCKAFNAPLRWRMEMSRRYDPDDKRPCFLYGVKRGNKRIFDFCERFGRTFYFCDNGYLGKRWQKGGYYRITRNDWMMPTFPETDYDRLEVHGIEIAPWRTDGEYILICPPIPEYCKAWGFDGEKWLARVQDRLRTATQRPLAISYKWSDPRAKADDPPLADRLRGAWALVAHDSNVAIDALIAGVPIFMTGKHPAARLAETDLGKIETPARPANRAGLLANLAANQWTLDEFRDGLPQRTLGLID